MSKDSGLLNRQYLDTKVNHVLEPLALELLRENPVDCVSYMLKYFQREHGNRPSINFNERMELEFLRSQISQMKAEQNQQIVSEGQEQQEQKQIMQGGQEDSDEDSEEEADQMHDSSPVGKRTLHIRPSVLLRFRQSVSAEAYGNFNKYKKFTPPIYPKSGDIKQQIRVQIESSFLFSHLNDEEKDTVVDAMYLKKAKKGDIIITQGDIGDNLYFVQEGTLNCTQYISKEQPQKLLRTYGKGEYFGELALLYNCARAASIQAMTDCSLWTLDRQTFNALGKELVIKKREMNEEFLSRVQELRDLNDYLKTKIADTMVEKSYQKGEEIIKKGDLVDCFYFIITGKAQSQSLNQDGIIESISAQYDEGGLFGAINIQMDIVAHEQIVAAKPLKVSILSKEKLKLILH